MFALTQLSVHSPDKELLSTASQTAPLDDLIWPDLKYTDQFIIAIIKSNFQAVFLPSEMDLEVCRNRCGIPVAYVKNPDVYYPAFMTVLFNKVAACISK